MKTRRARVRALALVGVLVVAGCDSGPKGPGVLTARVTSPQPLGAVVLEFTGGGITGFQGQGTTQVFGAIGSGGSDTHRVILVSPSGATEIRFGIEFADRGGKMPSVAAISAASPANAALTAGGLKVRIER